MVDGHYQLPIPFKDEKPRLPDARNMAEKRLKNLKRKLEANPTLRQQYIDGIQSLLDKGHAIEVPAESADKRSGIVWYLPHHPVINPNKDKPRIVFDCAARQGVTSLNSQVCSGPDLNNSLVGVLLRFRRHLVAFMGDVEAMFHQVKVDPDQQDALRFLWWPDGDMTGTPKPYKMTVHLFGGTWSPSVCAFALQRTAKEGQADFHPETIKAVERSFYVDDCLQSVATEEEAILQVQELGQLLGRRGFTIRKWVANSPRVLESVPEADRSKQVRERSIDSPLEERALGVYWSVESDCFSYKVREMEKPLTKRGLLSMLSSVYDPLGFAGPFILKARLIVQDLCRHGFEWDEAIPEEYEEQWQQWIAALPEMKAVKVPRCLQPPPDAEAATTSDGRSVKGRERSDIVVGPEPTLIHSAPVQPQSDTVTERRLHHFADASQIAYGVVSYLRTEYASGRVTVALTMAKSRLAPIKATTIPRLELCAATLATRQDELLRRELDLELSPSQYWSDSTIVLWYVSHEEKRFQTFVANRVSEIRGRSEPTQWRHVPTDENPADDASRGTSPAELTGRRWLEGPAFLKQPSEEWPVWEPSQPVDKEQLELRKEKVCMAVVGVPVDPIDTLLGRYSLWPAMRRGVARVMAIQKAQRDGESVVMELTTEHLQEAENAIFKHLQRQNYMKEIAALEDCKPILRSSKLARLTPRLKEGLIVSTGRLRNAPIPEAVRCPVVLPNDHHAVEVLIRHIHFSHGHAGREYMLAELRRRFWIIGATSIVRRVLGKCVECRRRAAQPCEQQMAQLPEDRVTPGGAAFKHVGVDYFGPFLAKRGRGTVKRYGCLFTCLTSRAVHIEVAHSLSTSSFMNCLSRFMARRGRPEVLRSDNGTNFVGADRELREAVSNLDNSALRDQLLDQGIKWRFNPPQASHMGGVWERQIRTTRRVLTGLSREQQLSDDNLQTLMTTCEGIINNRPLTAASSDPNDLEALTPNHLLMLRPAAITPGPTYDADALRKTWRQVQHLTELFWERWTREYLPLLRTRTKWQEPRRNVAVGDVVMIMDHPLPRDQWKLGRVEEIKPGDDGRVRVVRLRTQGGELTRPVSKLCLLEAAV